MAPRLLEKWRRDTVNCSFVIVGRAVDTPEVGWMSVVVMLGDKLLHNTRRLIQLNYSIILGDLSN
jgi:hypothetical protein